MGIGRDAGGGGGAGRVNRAFTYLYIPISAWLTKRISYMIKIVCWADNANFGCIFLKMHLSNININKTTTDL